jgi:hypothetical protein
MAKAWIYQDPKQVKKLGAKKAAYYVGWWDPDGKRRCKSCGAGDAGQGKARKLARTIDAQLVTGTYQNPAKKTWADFREEYEAKILNSLAVGTRQLTREALNHFEGIINPARVWTIRTATVDAYRAKRRTAAGRDFRAGTEEAAYVHFAGPFRETLQGLQARGDAPRDCIGRRLVERLAGVRVHDRLAYFGDPGPAPR